MIITVWIKKVREDEAKKVDVELDRWSQVFSLVRTEHPGWEYLHDA